MHEGVQQDRVECNAKRFDVLRKEHRPSVKSLHGYPAVLQECSHTVGIVMFLYSILVLIIGERNLRRSFTNGNLGYAITGTETYIMLSVFYDRGDKIVAQSVFRIVYMPFTARKEQQ